MPMDAKELERLLRKSVLLNRNNPEPIHAQLTRALRNLIVREFKDGEPFYPEETLSQRLSLSTGTVRRSLIHLMDEGLLERHRGKGSFVKHKKPLNASQFHIEAVVNTYDSFFNRTLLREISFLCQTKGLVLNVSNPGQDERVSKILNPSEITPGQFGLVLLSLDDDFTFDLHHNAEKMEIPCINVDTHIEGFFGHQIRVDNRKGIEIGLAHLASLGHKKIALLLSEPPLHINITERVEAFNALTSAWGLQGYVIESEPDPLCSDFSHDMVFATEKRYDHRISPRVVRQIFDAGVTAVFCVSDIGACFLIKRLHALHFRLPQKISIVGFNDEGLCLLVHPEITTIAQPYSAMASHIVTLLTTPGATPRHLQMEPTLIVRQSTAPPSLK